MGFLEDAQSMVGKGLSAARGTVSNVALESVGFVRRFVRMCDDGWQQGWHERNGGNASYRLTAEEADRARPFLDEEPGPWQPLGAADAALAGSLFLVTASGSYMRNVAGDPAHTTGIVEIAPDGGAWRRVWGLRDGGRPTSELAGHLLIHAARMRESSGVDRVLYHAHPAAVIALSKVVPCDPRAMTRVLWDAMTECVMVFPEGVGVVGCEVPGSLELARASAEQMERRRAVVWAHHGLLCAGTDFDDAFGRMHAVVKAAEITCRALSMAGGDASAVARIPDDAIRAIAASLGLSIDESVLGAQPPSA